MAMTDFALHIYENTVLDDASKSYLLSILPEGTTDDNELEEDLKTSSMKFQHAKRNNESDFEKSAKRNQKISDAGALAMGAGIGISAVGAGVAGFQHSKIKQFEKKLKRQQEALQKAENEEEQNKIKKEMIATAAQMMKAKKKAKLAKNTAIAGVATYGAGAGAQHVAKSQASSACKKFNRNSEEIHSNFMKSLRAAQQSRKTGQV